MEIKTRQDIRDLLDNIRVAEYYHEGAKQYLDALLTNRRPLSTPVSPTSTQVQEAEKAFANAQERLDKVMQDAEDALVALLPKTRTPDEGAEKSDQYMLVFSGWAAVSRRLGPFRRLSCGELIYADGRCVAMREGRDGVPSWSLGWKVLGEPETVYERYDIVKEG